MSNETKTRLKQELKNCKTSDGVDFNALFNDTQALEDAAQTIVDMYDYRGFDIIGYTEPELRPVAELVAQKFHAIHTWEVRTSQVTIESHGDVQWTNAPIWDRTLLYIVSKIGYGDDFKKTMWKLNRKSDATVNDIIVFIDSKLGAKDDLDKGNIKLVSLFTSDEI